MCLYLIGIWFSVIPFVFGLPHWLGVKVDTKKKPLKEFGAFSFKGRGYARPIAFILCLRKFVLKSS